MDTAGVKSVMHQGEMVSAFNMEVAPQTSPNKLDNPYLIKRKRYDIPADP